MASRWKAQGIGKPLVSSDQNRAQGLGVLKNFLICVAAQTQVPHVFRPVPCLPQSFCCRAGHIFVDQEPPTHEVARISSSASTLAA